MLCKRCSVQISGGHLCEMCTEVVALCADISDFAARVVTPVQRLIDISGGAEDAATLIVRDLLSPVVVLGIADGELSTPELAIMAELLCFLVPNRVGGGNAMDVAARYAKAFLSDVQHLRPTAPQSLPYMDLHDRAYGTHLGYVFRNLLFRLANLVARIDGVVTVEELYCLQDYRRVLTTSDSGQSASEPPQGAGEFVTSARTGQPQVEQSEAGPAHKTADIGKKVSNIPEAPPMTVEEAMRELHELIGLDRVKADVQQLATFLEVEQLRKQRGLQQSSTSRHLVFYGNPGTGKTTVARLIAQVYRAMGFLSKGQLVEADKSALVGAWLGQTAIKTKEVIDQALGGVLFIDEAYSLASDDSDRDLYGREAIETVLKFMEDYRDNLVVIVAGYPEEMGRFLESNPGLKSRFTRFIDFPDYTPDEMMQIFLSFASKSQYKLTPAASEKLLSIFSRLYDTRDTHFGNGRDVRNLFQLTISNLAGRVVTQPRVTNELLITIEAVDVPELPAPTPKKRTKVDIGDVMKQGTTPRKA